MFFKNRRKIKELERKLKFQEMDCNLRFQINLTQINSLLSKQKEIILYLQSQNDLSKKYTKDEPKYRS